MSEDLTIVRGDKMVKYRSLIPQIAALIAGEGDLIANLANICAALKEQFDFLWVGFYLVNGNELVLGPFQGPVACSRIAKGKGVCGTVWERGRTLVVPEVDAFPGHISCSSASKSEIVVPIIRNGSVVAVLDVDSAELNFFDETDRLFLEQVADLNFFNGEITE